MHSYMEVNSMERSGDLCLSKCCTSSMAVETVNIRNVTHLRNLLFESYHQLLAHMLRVKSWGAKVHNESPAHHMISFIGTSCSAVGWCQHAG